MCTSMVSQMYIDAITTYFVPPPFFKVYIYAALSRYQLQRAIEHFLDELLFRHNVNINAILFILFLFILFVVALREA